jgi:hypothetical protein
MIRGEAARMVMHIPRVPDKDAQGVSVLVTQRMAEKGEPGTIASTLARNWHGPNQKHTMIPPIRESHAAKLQTALGTRQPVSAVLEAANRTTTGCTDSEKDALPEHYDRTDHPLPPDQKLHSSDSFCWELGRRR